MWSSLYRSFDLSYILKTILQDSDTQTVSHIMLYIVRMIGFWIIKSLLYISTHPERRHQSDVSELLHASSALTPGMNPGTY